MKNFMKIAGITAMVAVIGLSFIACFGSGGGSGGGNSGDSGGGSGEAPAQVANGGEPYVIPASDFVYELSPDSTGVRILEYTGPGGNIIFPTEIEGLPIVEFDDVGLYNVTSVVFPDSYLRFFESDNPDFVEAKKMANTFNAAEVFALHASVGSPIDINIIMFRDDNPLENAVFPKGISYIPAVFFQSALTIKSYTIPDTVKFISKEAFSYSGLTSIVIPEGVTAIGSMAFTGCTDLKPVTLPESIIGIGDRAFGGCPNLETVNLPSHKINFYGDVFAGCTKLSLATQQALRNVGYTGSFN